MALVLGIESSCDETAAALVDHEGRVLADVVSSQVAVHAPYGGVVPELAARAHLANLVPVLEGALARIDGDWRRVDAVAVTQGPGLVGALLVGLQAAKAIAWARGLPLVGVNHLVGHLLAPFLRVPGHEALPPLPYIALLVSGGHTALYEVHGVDDVRQLGQTRDDAAGEAYDKVAKLLGLGYPGGPQIDALAAQGDPRALPLPRPLRGRQRLEFSFSGLKTAVAQHVAARGLPSDERGVADICASFQQAVIDVLVEKSLAACQQRSIPHLVLTGGVAANRGLRARAADVCARSQVQLYVPPVAACTDNAAMIAYAGACRLQSGQRDALSLPVFSRSPLLGPEARLPDVPSIKRPRPVRPA